MKLFINYIFLILTTENTNKTINLADKIRLKGVKYVALSSLSFCCTYKAQKVTKNNKCKLPGLTLDEKFE